MMPLTSSSSFPSPQFRGVTAPISGTAADDVVAGNYDDISSCGEPKGKRTDDWYSDEKPHNCSHNHHNSKHEQWTDGLRSVKPGNAEPQQVSPDHKPKGPLAHDRNFDKNTYDCGYCHHERKQASEEHSHSPQE